MKGAHVDCYIAATEHTDALRLAVKKLTEQGYVFEDLIDGQVHQLDPSKWDECISRVWPEVSNFFPLQADVVKLVRDGGVIFGPFCGWE
jgi:hypothetical protein